MKPRTTPQRSHTALWGRAVMLGSLLTAFGLWGPSLVAWVRPASAPIAGPGLFAARNTNIDLRDASGYLAWFGYERLEISPLRAVMVFAPSTTDPSLLALAELLLQIDAETLGPQTGDTLARPGLIVHLHRAGFPFRAVQASITEVHDASGARTLPPDGGILLPTNQRVPGAWPPLLPLSLSIGPVLLNLAFWTLLVGLPLQLSRALSRRRARRLGLCHACGYQRSGVPAGVCPECGQPATA